MHDTGEILSPGYKSALGEVFISGMTASQRMVVTALEALVGAVCLDGGEEEVKCAMEHAGVFEAPGT